MIFFQEATERSKALGWNWDFKFLEELLKESNVTDVLPDDLDAILCVVNGRLQEHAAAFAKAEERCRELEEALAKPADGDTSDGYHTFRELYDYRRVYNALLFNAWSVMGLFDVHKSKRHSDGDECFGGGWFIVVAKLPTGQISNHYKLEYWDEFNIPERELPNTYDGHTPAIALERARAALEGK